MAHYYEYLRVFIVRFSDPVALDSEAALTSRFYLIAGTINGLLGVNPNYLLGLTENLQYIALQMPIVATDNITHLGGPSLEHPSAALTTTLRVATLNSRPVTNKLMAFRAQALVHFNFASRSHGVNIHKSVWLCQLVYSSKNKKPAGLSTQRVFGTEGYS
jgi:hypothetical protein